MAAVDGANSCRTKQLMSRKDIKIGADLLYINRHVGNCLGASLLFCLQKAEVDVRGLTGRVTGRLERNEKKRLRIAELSVRMELDADAAPRTDRCLGLFEDYCMVTESVRGGIPVSVEVVDPAGGRLFSSGDEPASN